MIPAISVKSFTTVAHYVPPRAREGGEQNKWKSFSNLLTLLHAPSLVKAIHFCFASIQLDLMKTIIEFKNNKKREMIWYSVTSI